jgi:membrane protein YqaA with SNARE-associated domain
MNHTPGPGTDDAGQADSPASPKVARLGWLKRLYAWTIAWADHPAGPWVLFCLAFAESSFFIVPPDVLLIALCVGSPKKSFRFALICTAGAVLGGIGGYAIGLWGYELVGAKIVQAYHGEAIMDKIKLWYDTYGFWGNLAAAVTPSPYKVFTISSGVFHFSFAGFLAASVLGRGLRFFVVAALLHRFGPKVKVLIEKHFDWLALACLALLVGGFVLLKFL